VGNAILTARGTPAGMESSPTTTPSESARPVPPRPGASGPQFAGSARLIVPAKRRLRLRDLPAQLPVIRVVAARDYKVKYKQSLLGPLWLFIQPVALLGALVIAFNRVTTVSTGGVPYVLFALVGLAVWAFFQASAHMGTASLITNYQLVRRTPCPRFAFPLSAAIASLPSLAIPAVTALVVAGVGGHLSPRALLLPLGVVWLFVFTVGVVAITSSLAVQFRDIISALPFLLQVGVFVAPVGYSTAHLSSGIKLLISLNPLTGIIETWRWMILRGEAVATLPLVLSLVLTAAVAVFGWLLFARLEVSMADEI
jgi:lipopolysaccharide transport system permease protein